MTEPPDPVVYRGRYALQQSIGKGGMAEVFLARDQLLDRPVAIKRLAAEHSADPSFVERFRREAQAAAKLTHPNIVAVFDYFEEDGEYFIVQEFIDGRSLAELLRAEGRLHPDRAADIAADVAAGLGAAHREGMVHRDVKAGNVLVAKDGQVKVADFGIARVFAGGDSELTKAGTVMGTATYFSPEQAQGKPVDPRSDLYSLGVVLYEMLVGRPPFSGDEPVAIAYAHVHEAPKALRTVDPALPVEIDAITMKLLAKDPVNRYPSADDLRADLRRFREGAKLTPVPVVVPAAVPVDPTP
ncbi:MAG TPA: protein kinase, partial [Acidimicrobiales bacterium]